LNIYTAKVGRTNMVLFTRLGDICKRFTYKVMDGKELKF